MANIQHRILLVDRPRHSKQFNEASPLLPEFEIPQQYHTIEDRNENTKYWTRHLGKPISLFMALAIVFGIGFLLVYYFNTNTWDGDEQGPILTLSEAWAEDLKSNEFNSTSVSSVEDKFHPWNESLTTTTNDVEMLKFPLVDEKNTNICENALNGKNIKDENFKRHLYKRDLSVEPSPDCIYEFDQSCNANYEYQSADGSCNNLKYPNWGASQRPYRRLLMPDYGDGKGDKIRAASDGSQLPNARKIRLMIHTNLQKDDSKLSMLFPVFGQFISHDMSSFYSSVTRKNVSSASTTCCLLNKKFPKVQTPDCCPIEIEKNDLLYHKLNESCMNIIRGTNCDICPKGTPREQYSLSTSYLDGSVIYGSDNIRQMNLREGKFGRLKVSYYDKNGIILPPILISPTIQNGHMDGVSFNSGDDRVDTNLGITVMSLIWIKNHNSITYHLAQINSNWNDEKIFQEARKICIAQLQHITFNEYLPNLLGPIILKKAELELIKHNKYFNGYNETIDSTMANEFTTAAHRFGHSMIQGLVPFIKNGQDRNMTKYTNLSQTLENPSVLYEDHEIDNLIRGQASCPAAKPGVHMAYPLTNHFYRPRKNEIYGYDLPAIDIQRGRDYGIPGYGAWRKLCGFQPIQQFSDLYSIWNADVIKQAFKIFKFVEDVDLYTAGLAEHHVPGGKVGPTMACIIADQFHRIRKGDRFWYENKSQPKPFTLDQLNSIRKTTLARILCDNVDTLEGIQIQSLIQPSDSNKLLNCNSTMIPKIDYELWREFLN